MSFELPRKSVCGVVTLDAFKGDYKFLIKIFIIYIQCGCGIMDDNQGMKPQDFFKKS
jgi:hypothetical protein